MNKNISLDEKITNLENLLGIVLENQEVIKSHLWHQSNNKPDSTSEKELEQEKNIIDFLEKEIAPKAEGGEIGAKNIWMEILLNQIKSVAIELASRILEWLIDRGTEWAIEAADFALLKLQDFLYEKYLLANPNQKEIFKTKILEKFPESGLANKLKNE